jgi:hypothetical protein
LIELAKGNRPKHFAEDAMAKERTDIPNGLRRIYRRFEHWRGKHAGSRLPIPADCGERPQKRRGNRVCRTAQVLRLDYSKLKRLAEAWNANAEMGAKRLADALGPTPPIIFGTSRSPAIGVSECVIDLEGPQGKMRIQWKGSVNPDLAGLGRVLWELA